MLLGVPVVMETVHNKMSQVLEQLLLVSIKKKECNLNKQPFMELCI